MLDPPYTAKAEPDCIAAQKAKVESDCIVATKAKVEADCIAKVNRIVDGKAQAKANLYKSKYRTPPLLPHVRAAIDKVHKGRQSVRIVVANTMYNGKPLMSERTLRRYVE